MTIKVNTNVARILISAALTALLVPGAFAQRQSRKTAEDGTRAARTASNTVKATAMSNKGTEVFTDLTIGPGQSITLDSGLDYTYVDMVRVSVRSANTDLDALQFVAYWWVDGANFYNATQAVDGSAFVYGNVGGAQFCVYGSQFRLVLTNTGSSTINLLQVTLFAPAPPPPVEPDSSRSSTQVSRKIYVHLRSSAAPNLNR